VTVAGAVTIASNGVTLQAVQGLGGRGWAQASWSTGRAPRCLTRWSVHGILRRAFLRGAGAELVQIEPKLRRHALMMLEEGRTELPENMTKQAERPQKLKGE
jgi:hypothetical protein